MQNMTDLEKQYCEFVAEVSIDREQYIYLTSKNRQGGHISEDELDAAIASGQIGYILYNLDPVAFHLGMQDWNNNIEDYNDEDEWSEGEDWAEDKSVIDGMEIEELVQDSEQYQKIKSFLKIDTDFDFQRLIDWSNGFWQSPRFGEIQFQLSSQEGQTQLVVGDGLCVGTVVNENVNNNVKFYDLWVSAVVAFLDNTETGWDEFSKE